MSIDATRWAWEIQGISIAQKLVLLSMADRAGENNECWPSIERIKKDTCICNRHTIIDAIKELEKMGYIKSEKMPGKVSRYWLVSVKERHEETSAKSDTSAKNGTRPVPKVALPPVPFLAPEPISEPINEPVNPPLVPPTTFSATPKTAVPPADPWRGTRLPPGWKLPRAWGEWAMGQGVPEGRVRGMGESFADYWRAVPGEKGRKCDWEATWRNWVRRENERAPPAARTGVRPRNVQLEVEAANAAALREAKRKFREELAAKAATNEEQRA